MLRVTVRDILGTVRVSLRDRQVQHLAGGVVMDPTGVEGMLKTDHHPFQVSVCGKG
jgi:hypothetical protein